MALLSHSLLVLSDGELRDGGPRPPLWRVLHDKEIGPLWRPGLPEVFPLFPNHFSSFGEPWQRLSWEMNKQYLTPGKWTAVYGATTWIANHQGFGNEDDPRANYITGKDLMFANPRVEALTCGGNVLTGFVQGDNLVVSTLNVNNPPGSPDLIPRWHRTYAVSVDSHGQPRRFPQGEQDNGFMADIIHPLICNPARFVITIPLRLLEPWTAPGFPDPYRIYRI